MAYDPNADDAMRCECDPSNDDNEYPDGWDEFARSQIVPTLAAMKASGLCPRTSIRHSALYLAIMIAAVHSADGDSHKDFESMIQDVTGALPEMVEDALDHITEQLGRDRGSATGFKRVN